jgi:hypothetical protein
MTLAGCPERALEMGMMRVGSMNGLFGYKAPAMPKWICRREELAA